LHEIASGQRVLPLGLSAGPARLFGLAAIISWLRIGLHGLRGRRRRVEDADALRLRPSGALCLDRHYAAVDLDQ